MSDGFTAPQPIQLYYAFLFYNHPKAKTKLRTKMIFDHDKGKGWPFIALYYDGCSGIIKLDEI